MSETTNLAKKYSAPALEKGLDILELLSGEVAPISASAIASKLNRSNAEIYRMILVLEQREYIVKAEEIDGYKLSPKLLQLGLNQVSTKTLLDYAQPVMAELCEDIGMSCHLSILSKLDTVVIFNVQASDSISYSVPVGYRQPIFQDVSGVTLFSFQSKLKQEKILNNLKQQQLDFDLDSFLARSSQTAEQGYICATSKAVKGVTDLACPILVGDKAIASLNLPFIERIPQGVSLENALSNLKQAASTISDNMNKSLSNLY